jgi:Zn finger protein HypA/HybF involved in hydrogenase expression
MRDILNNLENLAKIHAKKLYEEKNLIKKKEIKRLIELNYGKVYKLRSKIIDQNFETFERLEKIERHCLRCDLFFLADGRFNRLCPRCQLRNFNIRPPTSVDIWE